jgi:hypothetical protein
MRPVPHGTPGRLAVKGPTGCRYLADPRQAKFVQQGWNLPGDTFVQDADGYLYYQARNDDMIISAGYNIAGPEVEDALMRHEAVAECGVVGMPDEERGQVVAAYVVLKPGFEGTPQMAAALQAYVKDSELYCYGSSGVIDRITLRIMALAKRWTPIASFSDAELAQRLRDDGIDILIDLSGFNAGTRMRVIAMEPAPLIVKWVGGLINTTGVESIDYLITDSIESPPGSDALYTEKLIRLPDDYICYLPPAQLPDCAPPPSASKGYITFGCFNNPTKINDVLLAEWARLLDALPDSRLFLKGAAFGAEHKRQRVLDALARHGIAAERIRMEGHSNHQDLLKAYHEVDIALDPWPYSGGLTTCEALLMGVPVVTLPGPTFAGRHSATHLANVGLPERAIQNRFESTVANLNNTVNNLSAARSRIEDSDYATEVSNMTKNQILQQAGTSVLAQANQVPQTVLSLLR